MWACFDTNNKDFWDASVKAARDFVHVAIPDQSSWTGGTVKGATVDWIRCVMNFVDRIYSAGIPTSYWDGTLYMLALLHVSATFHLYY